MTGHAGLLAYQEIDQDADAIGNTGEPNQIIAHRSLGLQNRDCVFGVRNHIDLAGADPP